jgi:hypothetical protein
MDMTAAARLVSIGMTKQYHAARTGWRRAGLVTDALPYASEWSRSPAETRLRLMWVVDAALPPPLVNCEVFEPSGKLICVADLLDPHAGVVVEYDGAEHRQAARHSKDVAREEACRRVGLEYCKVTGPDMRHPQVVLERFRSVRARAAYLAPERRGWTLEHPPGWSHPEPLHEVLTRRAVIAALMKAEHGIDVPPW